MFALILAPSSISTPLRTERADRAASAAATRPVLRIDQSSSTAVPVHLQVWRYECVATSSSSREPCVSPGDGWQWQRCWRRSVRLRRRRIRLASRRPDMSAMESPTPWMLMSDGVLFGTFNHQGGPRGGDELESTNWLDGHGAAAGRTWRVEVDRDVQP